MTKAPPILEEALSLQFLEGQRAELHLPEDNESAWHRFLYFLLEDNVTNSDENDRDMGDYLVELSHAFVLGDKYGASTFQTAVLKAIANILVYFNLLARDIVRSLHVVPLASSLGRMLLQEVVLNVTSKRVEGGDNWEWNHFEDLDVKGFWPEGMKCYGQYKDDPTGFEKRAYGGFPIRRD